ncbi:ABC transporter ATP-binding protein, partial [Streptomyces beijiangensis]
VVERGLGVLDVFPVPVLPEAPQQGPGETVLRVRGLVKTFPVLKGAAFKRRVGTVHAVDGVDLHIRRGETLALVGESGSGKSTTLFELLNLARPEGGTVELFGQSLDGLGKSGRKALRGQVQIVFQDPMASLDPRMTVGDTVAEPLRAQGVDRRDAARRIPQLLTQVGLEAAHADRFPHEFSGGQRQRIGIARALSVEPQLLVLDEPVSALDVSVQAGVLNLLQRLKAELGLAYLFVSHDLSVVRHIADRVSVVYLGRTVEAGAVDEIFERPQHPYTQALLSAVPLLDPERERERQRTRILLPGDPPSATRRYEGCRFRTRCPVFAELGARERERCTSEVPLPVEHGADHVAACHFPAVRPVSVG